MQQNIKCSYVPKNWPVDDGCPGQINQAHSQYSIKSNSVLGNSSQVLAGCFKAKQMLHFGKNSWF
jgi:hypothetical protein